MPAFLAGVEPAFTLLADSDCRQCLECVSAVGLGRRVSAMGTRPEVESLQLAMSKCGRRDTVAGVSVWTRAKQMGDPGLIRVRVDDQAQSPN